MTMTNNVWHSAEDLPTIQQFRRQLQILNGVTWSLALFHPFRMHEVRQLIVSIKRDLDELVTLVDSFYDLLGSRHWIFTDCCFDLNFARRLVKLKTAEEAEKQLIAYYQTEGTLEFGLARLQSQDAMIARIPLLKLALEDYRAGRYYSTVLVLFTVMDGFVNDCYPEERRNLTARDEKEMSIVENAASQDRGLPASQKLFHKGFRKLDENEVTEVYRNGIVHGMLTNYNNVIVATKAWNMLFAVFDWKEARDVKEKKDEEKADGPTPRQILEQARHNRENGKKYKTWTEYTVDPNHPEMDRYGAYQACTDFLTAWQKKNYGALGRFLFNLTGDSMRRKSGEARRFYDITTLNSWRIIKAERPAAAKATFEVYLECDSFQDTRKLHFLRVKAGDDMDPVPEWEPGRWVLVGGYANIPIPPPKETT